MDNYKTPMTERAIRVRKFYSGWFGITSNKKAREWLNNETEKKDNIDHQLVREVENELLRKRIDEHFRNTDLLD